MTLPPTQECPRQVLIVEDQADARAWLKTQGTCLAGSSGALALIDLGMPNGSGIDIIRELNARYPTILRIATTIYDDDRHLFETIAAGAQSYLLKDRHPDTIVQYLHRIDNGEPPPSPSIAQRMLQHFAQVKLRAPI
jgi:DNA-binding NarL/FixJ family response regulator